MKLAAALLLLASAALAQRPEFVRIPGKAFSMGKTEVTVAEFAAFVKATGYLTAAERAKAPRNWKVTGFKVSRDQPVVYVTPGDAMAYCAWAGGRLPRDEEWEYAARAGSTGHYYWGSEIDGRYLWYRANSDDRPHAVGKKLPNAWGLYDVLGNVWEWAISDPIKGEAYANRRGGSWVDCTAIESESGPGPKPLISFTTFFKIAVKADHRHDDIGFRCLRDPNR